MRTTDTPVDTPVDTVTVAGLLAAADAEVDGLLTGTLEAGYQARGHRGLMAMVKAAVVVVVHPGSAWRGDPAPVERAGRWLTDLEALQAPGGLFSSGDNLASPPDSAFTVADVAIVTDLLRRYDGPGLDGLRARLTAVLASAARALVTGGVHTPNHRWELASALARTGTLLDDDALLARARAWLAEGVDVDDDGLYSERSPNYAAHVSNPSLIALGGLLGRPDLHDVVHRDLHAQLDLTDPAGAIETVCSRRQDQNAPFPLGPFLGQLRWAAVRFDCPRCAGGAARAASSAGVDAVDVLAQQLLDPGLAAALPAHAPDDDAPPTRRYFRSAGLVMDHRPATGSRFVVYGGSDVPALRRIASGLACNPTFLRAALGGPAVESVRLSRDFFGLGPFRASTMSVSGDRVELREEVSASYYQPLDPTSRSGGAAWTLEHEGRFAAAMSFSERERDVVTLRTDVTVDLHDDGVDLTVTTDGPATGHALELALAPGGELSGVRDLGGDRFELTGGEARYTRDGRTLVVGPGHGSGHDQPAVYRPGEAYTFLGGTDALGGTRLYVTWRSPGTVSLRLRLA